MLPIALALVSAAALVVEIAAGRLLAPYLGMSLYTWTAIIAVVLAGLSAGHWIGGVLDPGDRRRSFRWVAAALVLSALSTALVPVFVRTFSGAVLATQLPPLMTITVLVFSLFFLPSLFAGTVAPILTRLALDEEVESRSRVLGRMFAAGALGSIAGTVLSGFVLITWVGTLGTLIGVAVLEALLAIAFYAMARPGARAIVVSAVLSLLVCAALIVASRQTAALVSACTIESSYFCIRVVDYEQESDRASRLLVIDHMGHGISDRDEPRWLHSSYTALTDRLVHLRGIAARPFSAFFIGGGAYTLPRAWLQALPHARITVAELDPQVTRIAHEQFWLEESESLRILHGDARPVLATTLADERFDVIVGDAFHDISVPAHLTTREFAHTVRSHLRDDGIYLVHVLDLTSDPKFLLALTRTLMDVFPAVEVWVDERQWQTGGRISYVLLAANESSTATRLRGVSPDDIAQQRAWRKLPVQAMRSAALETQVPVLIDDLAPVDRLMFHVLEKDL